MSIPFDDKRPSAFPSKKADLGPSLLSALPSGDPAEMWWDVIDHDTWGRLTSAWKRMTSSVDLPHEARGPLSWIVIDGRWERAKHPTDPEPPSKSVRDLKKIHATVGKLLDEIETLGSGARSAVAIAEPWDGAGGQSLLERAGERPLAAEIAVITGLHGRLADAIAIAQEWKGSVGPDRTLRKVVRRIDDLLIEHGGRLVRASPQPKTERGLATARKGEACEEFVTEITRMICGDWKGGTVDDAIKDVITEHRSMGKLA